MNERPANCERCHACRRSGRRQTLAYLGLMLALAVGLYAAQRQGIEDVRSLAKKQAADTRTLSREQTRQARALAHRLASQNRQELVNRCASGNASRRRNNVRTAVLRDFILAAVTIRRENAALETNPQLRVEDLKAARRYLEDARKLSNDPIVDCATAIPPVK